LFLSIVGAIPGISPWDPITQITPTVFVLFVAIIREGIEDYMRYKSDLNTNEHKVWKIIKEGEKK
jgi:hypothetical protein